jgi:hypothetical protein
MKQNKPNKPSFKEIEPLLYLKEDELTAEELQMVKEHIHENKESYDIWSQQNSLDAFVNDYKNIPIDYDKEELVTNIVNRLPQQKAKKLEFQSRDLAKWLINAAAVFLIGFFLYQQVEMKKSLNELNSRIESQAASNGKGTSADAALYFKINNKSIEEKEEVLEYLKENYPEIYKEIIRNINSKPL